MGRSISRFTLAPVAALLLALTAVFGLGGVAPSVIYAATIECAPPATATTASGTPAAVPVASSPVAFPAGGGELTVFAAASLTDSFNEIKTTLESATPGLTITYNFAGSQALVTQLTEGASADVFASASNARMKDAIDGGLIAGSPNVFTQNRLAIVVPKDNPAGITGLADLAKEGLKLDLAAVEVPVGQYAHESICKASSDTASYGEDFVNKVAANVVSEEDNVKAVLAKVQLGEADAGIVYTTDVTADVAADVTLIEIPAAVNMVAKYPIAAVAGGDTALAQAFIDYILGPDGQAILATYGFEPKP